MLQAVAHEVKNLLAELALRVQALDPHAAALAHTAAGKLAHALLLENPEQLAPQIDAASPAELLDELAAEYRPLFPGKTLTIDTRTAPTLWYYDVHLIRLALGNIVHNALRYGKHAVTVKAQQIDATLVFEVRDDGPGFSQQQLNGDWSSKASLPPSTGLGLKLAHQIAAVHALVKQDVRRGELRLSNDNGGIASLLLP